jgi:hypothetical protein
MKPFHSIVLLRCEKACLLVRARHGSKGRFERLEVSVAT